MSRDSATVSNNMRKIHSKDTSIELLLRKALWHKGYRYRKNYKVLPGSPDIVLTKYKIAIFCDSEFFHGKDWEILKLRLEKGKNPDFWIKKIERNRNHDYENDCLNPCRQPLSYTKILFLYATSSAVALTFVKSISGNFDSWINPLYLLSYLRKLYN